MESIAARIVNINIKIAAEGYSDTLVKIAKAARSERISVEMASRTRYYAHHMYHRMELIAEDTPEENEELDRIMHQLVTLFLNEKHIYRWDTNVWYTSLV